MFPKLFRIRKVIIPSVILSGATYMVSTICRAEENPQAIWKEYYDNSKLASIIDSDICKGIFLKMLHDMPFEMQTNEMFKYMIDINKFIPFYIPVRYYNQELANYVFDKNPEYICCFPNKYKTTEMAKQLIEDKHYWMFCYIPNDIMTKEISEKLMEVDKGGIKYIPKRFMTQEMCYEAVEHDPELYFYVPRKYKTEHMRKYVSIFIISYYYRIPTIRFGQDENVAKTRMLEEFEKVGEYDEKILNLIPKEFQQENQS